MALAVSLTAGVPSPPPPPFAGKFSHGRSQDDLRISHNCLQATIKFEQPKLVGHISRREALLASTVLLGNLIASEAAEGRRIKPETRRKIREKLDKLREKGEVKKEKADSNPGKNEQELPKRLNRMSVPLVEATI